MWVYIIKSELTNKHYIGHTSDLQKRLKWHNSGCTKSTKSGIPWGLIYNEVLEDRSAAIRREKQIKSYKGGEAFKKLLNTGGVA